MVSCSPSNGSSEGASQEYKLPASAGIAPADIMEHIVFSEGGGAGGLDTGRCPCLEIKGKSVSIYGFEPNEEYRVVIYTLFQGSDLAWNPLEGRYFFHWNVIVDDSGSLEFQVESMLDPDFYYMVYDQTGNPVYGYLLVNDAKQIFDTSALKPTLNAYPCPDTYPTQFAIGMTGYVSPYPSGANNVRQNANLESALVGQIPNSGRFQILDGPKCSNGWIWWKVRALDSDLTGWTSEGDKSNYWLTPEQ